MNPFLREHARPLIGSALLHLCLLAGVVLTAWFTVAPTLVQPAAIEAYLAPASRSYAGATPSTPPVPTPVEQAAPDPTPEPPAAPPAPAPDPAIAAREQLALAATQQAEQRRVVHDAQVRAVAAQQQALAAEAKRKADTAAKRAATEQAAAKKAATEQAAAKKAASEQAAAKKRAAAIEAEQRAIAADAKRRTEADSRARAQRESDLTRQLADETHRLGAENAGLKSRYAADIQAHIEQAWHRPSSAHAGISCEVDVTQVQGGTVTDVTVGACNGDQAVIESIKLAVLRASPLPTPPDPSLFERKIHLVFHPDG